MPRTPVNDWEREYFVLRDEVAVQLRPGYGALVLGDEDRGDFLQRMTTNDIAALRPGQSTVTVLTSPTARILFVFTVVCREDDLLLLPAAGEAAALATHLRGKLFFMDKVAVEDVSDQHRRVRVMGPQADARLASDGPTLTTADDGAWTQQDGALIVKQLNYDVPGYEILIPDDHFDRFMTHLNEADVTVLDSSAAYHALRVEMGRPLPAHEATQDYSPLEAGLAWTCAENKGCYTGQEIIARQITYDKVTKRLVRLRSEQPLDVGATVISESDAKIGKVTSVAHSPALNAPIALAIINRAHANGEVAVDAVAVEIIELIGMRD